MPGLSNPVVASDSSGVRVICDTSGAVWPSRPTLQPERKFGHVLGRDFASGRGDWTANPVPEKHGKKERPREPSPKAAPRSPFPLQVRASGTSVPRV